MPLEINFYYFQRLKTKIKKAIKEPNLLFKQIKANLLYRNLSFLNNGYSFDLNNLILFLTFDCNLNCKICSFRGQSKIGKKYDNNEKLFFLENSQKLIDETFHFRPNIFLDGGEPLLDNNWKDLAIYIKKKNLKLTLLTNGVRLIENAQDIVQNVDNLNISLDAPQAEIHNQIRGGKNTFEKVISGIKEIDKIKKLNKKNNPRISICYTVSNLNYKYLEETVIFLSNLNVELEKIVFQHLLFTKEEIVQQHKKKYEEILSWDENVWEGLYYSPELDINYLLQEIIKVKKKNLKNLKIVFFPDFTLRETKYYYSNTKPPLRFQRKCLSPYLEAYVFSNGDVQLCPGYTIGNLKEESFKKIWNNEKAKTLRKILNKDKIFSVCKSCCGLYTY